MRNNRVYTYSYGKWWGLQRDVVSKGYHPYRPSRAWVYTGPYTASRARYIWEEEKNSCQGNTENQLFQYCPPMKDNNIIVFFCYIIKSVLWFKSGYTVKYSLSPRAQAIFHRIYFLSYIILQLSPFALKCTELKVIGIG